MSIDSTKPAGPAHPEVHEDNNVQDLHAPIMREKAEPRDGFEPIPPWLTPIFGILLFWGGWYMAKHSADFRADILSETNQPVGVAAGPKKELSPVEKGAKLYEKNCASCHRATGEGKPGEIPPVAGSEWVTDRNPAVVKRILLHGLSGPITVKGANYNNNMPNLQLKDDEIAALATYIRQAWGNQAKEGPAEITPAMVAETRKATAGRTTPWTATELQSLTADDGK